MHGGCSDDFEIGLPGRLLVVLGAELSIRLEHHRHVGVSELLGQIPGVLSSCQDTRVIRVPVLIRVCVSD